MLLCTYLLSAVMRMAPMVERVLTPAIIMGTFCESYGFSGLDGITISHPGLTRPWFKRLTCPLA